MYLKKTKQPNGRVSLGVVESYRKDGKPRQRTVKSLGYLDELEKIHKDPIAWGEAIAKEMTEKKNAACAAVSITIHPMQKISKRSSGRKNIGCACALSVYEALGIPIPLNNRQAKLKCNYDLNSVVRLLVCERIIDPGSKRAALKNRDHYFFKSDFSEDDLYRALDEIAAAKDSIVSAMNRRIANACMRDLTQIYYDVTNYYFECDEEDELRRRGVSKENRKDPLVSMGLIQDAHGIPIGYRIFPGNTADCQTMVPVLSDMKRSCGIERVVVVADKGCNSSDNIVATAAKGDGFVFSQSLRGTKSDAELKAWVLDDTGYAYKGENRDFKIKSCQGFKKVHLKADETASGKPEEVLIEVKYVAFWSKKYAKRARAERDKAIEKACALIKNPAAYTKHTSYGAAKYVKNLRFDKKTGEVIDGKRALSLDEKKIAEEEKLDGYYLILTSEITWSDERIVDTYRELWRIEETFKVTKSHLETRPVFVWTPQHIEAHFLICYIALTILRLLQYTTGLSPSTIKDELYAMWGINMDANWWVFDHRTNESDLIVEACGLEELKLKNLQTKDIRSIIAKAKRAGFPHKK